MLCLLGAMLCLLGAILCCIKAPLAAPRASNPTLRAGAVAFELLARRQLLPVGRSLADYESRVHSLSLMDMTGQ